MTTQQELEELAEKFVNPRGHATSHFTNTLKHTMNDRKECFIAGARSRESEVEKMENLMWDSIARAPQDSTITAPLREYFKNKKGGISHE